MSASSSFISPVFKNFSPKGTGIQPYQKQKYTVNCQGNLSTFKTYELIRFQFGTNQWFDPYNNYFEIEVQMDKTNYGPYDMLCLDGPSTSLISELTISINNVEIERIYEHDQIGKFLSDFHVKKDAKKFKLNEGYIYDCTHYALHGIQNTIQSYDFQINGTTSVQRLGRFKPNSSFYNQAIGLNPNVSNTNVSTLYNTEVSMQQLPFQITETNHENLYVAGSNTTIIAPNFKYGQYLSMHDHLMGVQSIESCQGLYNLDTTLNSSTSIVRNDANQNNCYGHIRRPYSAYVEPDKYFYFMIGNTDYCNNGKYSFDFRRGTQYQYLSPGYLDSSSGLNTLNPQESGITKKTLIVPLLSSFMGSLIPPDQHRLLPGSFFGQIQIEMRMNRYAFFTSGLKNGGKIIGENQTILDTYGGSSGSRTVDYTLNANQTILPRTWSFNKVDFVMELYQFKPQDEQQILSLYSNGIVLHSQFWYLAHQQSFANTALLEQNIQINQKHRSVKAVWWWYLLNDYENRPYCRKHFRISGNLTGIQAEFDNQYFPYHEIKGKAGNIIQNDVRDTTNQDMYMFFQDSMGALFNADVTLPYNQINYAINERCWDVTVFDKAYSSWNRTDIFNYGNGATVQHEWRQGIGGGVYCIPFEQIPQSGYQGLNLNNTPEPLILRIKSDKVNYNNSYNTMYVFFHLDVEYTIMPNGQINIDK